MPAALEGCLYFLRCRYFSLRHADAAAFAAFAHDVIAPLSSDIAAATLFFACWLTMLRYCFSITFIFRRAAADVITLCRYGAGARVRVRQQRRVKRQRAERVSPLRAMPEISLR